MIRRSWLALTFLLLVGPSVLGEARVDLCDDPLPEGALTRLGSIRFLHPSRIRHLAFLPGDQQILGVCEQEVRLWDVRTGRQTMSFPGLNSIMCAALSPDGKTAAVAENGARIFLLDLASGKVRNHVEGDRLGRAHSVAWSPDSRRLAATMGPTVFLWDAVSGKLLRRLQGDSKFLQQVAFAPDGNVLAFGDDHAVELWDLATGKKLRNLEGGLDWGAGSLTFAPDGKTLVGPCTARLSKNSSRSSLRQWDTDGKKFRDLTLGTFNCVAFSPDGSLLAAANGLDIHICDPVSGKELRKWPGHVAHVWTLAFSRDGKILASGGVDHRIRLWDAATGKELRPTPGHLGAVNAVAFSPNGKVVASAGLDATIRFWDRHTGREIKRCDGVGVRALGSHWGARDLAFSPDGKTVVSFEANFQDPKFRLWTAEGKLLSRFGDPGYHASAVAFAPDNKTVVAAYANTIAVFDPRTNKVLRSFKKKEYLTSLSLSPDGSKVAWMGQYGPFGVFDLETGKDIFQTKISANKFAFSPDGSTVACSDHQDIRFLNAITANKVSVWKQASGAFAFSPDGRLIAAATARGFALWDILARQEARLWGSHQRSINGLAFSPDGRVVVTAHEDGTLLVLDVTGLCKAGKFPALKLSDKELEIQYADLKGDNAAHAHRAIWTLAAAAPASLDLVARHLQPAPDDAARITRLIAELDDKSFAVRTKAMAALIELGGRAEPALRKTLLSSPPIEVQRRITTILGKLDHKALAAKWLHTRRLLAVVEYAGTPEARQILERLAAGAPDAPLTREATAALKRLAR